MQLNGSGVDDDDCQKKVLKRPFFCTAAPEAAPEEFD